MVIEIPNEIDSFLSVLKGVPGIKSVLIRRQNQTGGIEGNAVRKFLALCKIANSNSKSARVLRRFR
ncbi:hypothetical protein LEP1GSC050_2466 [Leptospira broomii serovar Hurstbridge str. 5399]|uniref:Uncharacterized protein n=1 Tax=Leptospira broomii serovar Hurstbridge str. 5399 TaxID=1049789 RepID=T0GFA5_9LEPT|nr:hypothetical protein LEP1GSC050_2466 [Leptospira broomii serovar Hurstbridge str. 5399]